MTGLTDDMKADFHVMKDAAYQTGQTGCPVGHTPTGPYTTQRAAGKYPSAAASANMTMGMVGLHSLLLLLQWLHMTFPRLTMHNRHPLQHILVQTLTIAKR